VRLATRPRKAAPAAPRPGHGERSLPALDRARRALAALASDPIEFYTRVASELSERPERKRPIRPYVVDGDWDTQLHVHLGLSTPCKAAADATAV
jgi:hypothetical protein